MRIAIDCRMKYGVGTILKNVVPKIADVVDYLFLLGEEREINSWGLRSSRHSIIPFTHRIYSPKEQFFFPRGLMKKIDIYHCPHYNIPLVNYHGARLVVTINDLIHLSQVFPTTAFQRLYADFFIRKAVKRSSHIITISNFSGREIMKNFEVDEDKLSVAYCGLDRSVFRSRSRGEFQKIAKKFELIEPFILTTGCLRPHKNVLTLIKSFQKMKTEAQIPHRLVVVGEPQNFRTNSSKAAVGEDMANDILFLGHISDEELAVLYSYCSVFVFPSLYEGFGLPPLEAMACGAPLVVSNRTSLPEIIGNAGILVDPLNDTQIAEAVLEVIRDESTRRELKRRSKIQSQKYSWDDTVKLYLHAYDKALDYRSR